MPDRIIGISGNAEHPRLRTRVKGFDLLLDGGLLAGDAYLISGGPGTGKTTLGNQIAFRHAAAGERSIIFMLQTEPHEWMLAHLGGFEFVQPELINKRIHYVSLLRQLEHEGLHGVLKSIQATVRELDASLIVLDGAGLLESHSETEAGFGRFVRDLQARTAMLNCTSVLLSSRTAQPVLAPHVDGVIELDYEPFESRDTRWVRISKQRGARHLNGRHQFAIDGRGVVVFPRLESVGTPDLPEETGNLQRLSTGVSGLDDMLGGGLIRRSVTAAFGAPGSGKTLLDLQFLGAGAAIGERGMLFTFHETAGALLTMGDRLAVSFAEGWRSQNIDVRWEPDLERSPDAWAWSLLEAVDEFRPARLAIDGFSDVARMFVFLSRQTGFGLALARELRTRKVTTLINLELDSYVQQQIVLPVPRFAPIIDTAVLLRSVESDSETHRLLSVLKHRESWFDPTIRAYAIDAGGIAVERQVGS